MAPYDIMWSACLVPVIVLMVTGLLSLFRRVNEMTFVSALIWFLVIVLLPVIGPIVWFVVRKPRPAGSRQPIKEEQ